MMPDRVTIKLGPSKTDPTGIAPPRVIAACPAVAALWRWFHARRVMETCSDRCTITSMTAYSTLAHVCAFSTFASRLSSSSNSVFAAGRLQGRLDATDARRRPQDVSHATTEKTERDLAKRQSRKEKKHGDMHECQDAEGWRDRQRMPTAVVQSATHRSEPATIVERGQCIVAPES